MAEPRKGYVYPRQEVTILFPSLMLGPMNLQLLRTSTLGAGVLGTEGLIWMQILGLRLLVPGIGTSEVGELSGFGRLSESSCML